MIAQLLAIYPPNRAYKVFGFGVHICLAGAPEVRKHLPRATYYRYLRELVLAGADPRDPSFPAAIRSGILPLVDPLGIAASLDQLAEAFRDLARQQRLLPPSPTRRRDS